MADSSIFLATQVLASTTWIWTRRRLLLADTIRDLGLPTWSSDPCPLKALTNAASQQPITDAPKPRIMQLSFKF